MFWRKKSTRAKSEDSKLITDFIEYQYETERMQKAARSSQQTVAILRPQIPIGVGPSVGWFGGHARLPEGIAWPMRDGQELIFVGQIDLSALPRDLWSGLGPRSGWLGIFLPEKGPLKPTVLHFDGSLVEAKGPIPNSVVWTRPELFKGPDTFALPKWPLIVETCPGHELHRSDTGGPVPKSHRRTLLDPAYQPFNPETIWLLCDELSGAVTDLAKRIVRFAAMKKLRPVDAAWFERMQPIVLETFVWFFEAEARLRSLRKIDRVHIIDFIDTLKNLRIFDLEYVRDDHDGYAELILKEMTLLEFLPGKPILPFWWEMYEIGLAKHALKAYTAPPDSMPEALRERLEAEWRNEMRDGLALMGHAPRGHIYTPHGPASANEVLLEIRTSNIAGFMWGDCYSIVLLIDRNALRRGDFSDVMFDITN